VFNRPPVQRCRRRFARSASIAAMILLASGLCGKAAAQQANPPIAALDPSPPVNASFSVSSPAQLADWQKRLTLGAGDVLNISLYEQPDSDRKGLIIGPDGRLNYLQARDVVAAGLTVDELR